MTVRRPRVGLVLLLPIALVACGGAPAPARTGTPVPRPVATNDTAPRAAEPETLAFQIREGDIQNEFFRRGPIAVHALATSGRRPRLLFAFPAGNAGIGMWLEDPGRPVGLTIEDGLEPVQREGDLRGVRTTVSSDQPQLVVRSTVLASIRVLRDFDRLGTAPPAVRAEVVPGASPHLRRTVADGQHHLDLVIEPRGGTVATVRPDGAIELRAPSTVRFAVTALQDDPPLHPIETRELLAPGAPPPDERMLQVLAFLSYREKLLAGSWRFLTYFGRDTLLSLRLSMPALSDETIEAGLGAVIERLDPGGEVAHEEDIGEFPALGGRAAPGTSTYDYKMIDDDFMLAPIVAAWALDRPSGRARAGQWLARRTSGGRTFADGLRANLRFVLEQARPYARDPSPPHLVALRPGIPVGEWRDSEEGLGRGRIAYDVNAALVPAALSAAARLYDELLGDAAAAQEARNLAEAWRSASRPFHVEIPLAQARTRVQAAAREAGIDPAPALASLGEPRITFPALALDAGARPIPVMNSDPGFAMLFGEPTAAELDEAAALVSRPFPAGLRTPAGLVVANAAFVSDPAVRDIFSRQHYHGAVVWSWQQALWAAGLARQRARTDLPEPTRAALTRAERELWQVIEATSALRTSELWTWEVQDGRIVPEPFGREREHADESNAAQLWSTVYLAVRPPRDLPAD